MGFVLGFGELLRLQVPVFCNAPVFLVMRWHITLFQWHITKNGRITIICGS